MSNGFDVLAPIDNSCFNCRYNLSSGKRGRYTPGLEPNKQRKHCTPNWAQGKPNAISYSNWKPRTWWQKLLDRFDNG
jgi:hypothetical protein